MTVFVKRFSEIAQYFLFQPADLHLADAKMLCHLTLGFIFKIAQLYQFPLCLIQKTEQLLHEHPV